MPKATQLLYHFHKDLNAPGMGSLGLMEMGLERIAKTLKTDVISSFLWDEARGALSLQVSCSRGRSLLSEQTIHLFEGQPLWGLISGDKESLSFHEPHEILYVPLIWEGVEKPLGVLRLERPRGKPFSREAKRLAADFAQELAQNLQRTAQGEANRQQLKRLSTITELAAIFASSLRVQDSLRLILQGVQSHFAFDRVRLYVVDKSGQKLKGELGVDIRGRIHNLREEEYPLEAGRHRFTDVLLTNSGDAAAERYRDVVLYLPLVVQAQKIGLLILDNLTSQLPIPREDAWMLKSFAGQIALAVDNARLFDEVEELSLYDSLTRLPLRRYFNQRVQEEMYRAERFGQPLAVALLDIDFFKEINDRFGHQIGDLALLEVSKSLLKNLRKIDFPCRYGGDEILVLLPQAREDDAKMITSRLLQEIRKVRIPVPFSKAKEFGVTVSIGVANYPTDSKTVEGLIEKADEALYWVKSHGRDGVALFQSLAQSAVQPTLFDSGSAAPAAALPELPPQEDGKEPQVR